MSLDLQLIPTPELIEELVSRFAATIVTAVNADDEVLCVLDGSSLVVRGLLSNAQDEILLASFKGSQ